MKRWLVRALLRAALLLFGYVVLVNGTVRWLASGEVALLDCRFVAEKSTALLRLGAHVALHPLRASEPAAEPLLRQAARQHHLPAAFVLAVGRAESALSPHRISRAGAMGLMQLMPQTAAELGVRDPFDVRQSIAGGVAYLAQLWRRYGGDRRRVAAAYNAGPGAVARRGELLLPAETMAYVRQVMQTRGGR